MRELEYLEVIKATLAKHSLIGDDCAFLEDLCIAITQDSLCEHVHFKMDTTSAYDLGYKSVAVNLSDLAAAATRPKYLTIAISLPRNVDKLFVPEFYEGVNDICKKYDVEVIGGDITSSRNIFISVTAIGKAISQFKSSRKNAKSGDLVITTGEHGSSTAGLALLNLKSTKIPELIDAHLKPEPAVKQGLALAKAVTSDFAAMDTSDGLADTLYKIATASNVTLDIDFEKVPRSSKLIHVVNDENTVTNWVLWGGEDYKLVACVDESTYEKLDKNDFTIIGKVIEKQPNKPVLIANCKNITYINEQIFNTHSFNHFENV